MTSICNLSRSGKCLRRRGVFCLGMRWNRVFRLVLVGRVAECYFRIVREAVRLVRLVQPVRQLALPRILPASLCSPGADTPLGLTPRKFSFDSLSNCAYYAAFNKAPLCQIKTEYSGVHG